jgi:predicted dehydrogenase
MDRVRIGIIGTSGWSDMYFLPILSRYERADLAAICGRNQERAGEMAAKYHIPQVFSDYRRMIDEAQLEALVIATPDDLHYEMVIAALDARLHILCEKPLANNAEHARQMFDKAETAGLKHMVNHTWRWTPQIQYIKHLIGECYLGQVYQANFRFAFGWRNQRDYNWIHDADRSNGVIGSTGAHMIDMARWLIGDVTSISASLTTQVERDGVNGRPLNPSNDSAFLLLNFSNGTQGCIQNSYVTHMADKSGISVSLYGENGTLHTDYFLSHLDCVVYGAQRGEDTLHPLEIPPAFTSGFKAGDMFAHFMTNSIGPRLFIDSILNDEAMEPNFYDGYLNQKVIDAALESQRSGRRVTIS